MGTLSGLSEMGQQPQPLFGNNRSFCKGRFISGPDWRSCIASFLMILVPSIIWHCVVGVFYSARYTPTLPIIAALLQVGALTLLLATSLSDPGIMPRQKDFTEHYDAATKSHRTKQPPRYHDLVLRGHPFKLKYCTTCNIYRPPRCTHCSVCEDCIERFDHHCPWLGNCIGKRNYWLFYGFVSCTGAINVLTLGTSIAQIAVLGYEAQRSGLSSGDSLVSAMRQEPLSAALVLYSAAIVWFTVGLCSYHNYLVCTNQTTYEQIKGVYSTPAQNPFNRGFIGNFRDVLFSSVRPRYFNPFTGQMLWPAATSDSALELKRNLGSEAKVEPPLEVTTARTAKSSPASGQVVAADSSPAEKEPRPE